MTYYRTLTTNANILGRCLYSPPKPFSVEFHSVLLSTGHLPAVRAEVWACLVSAMEFRVWIPNSFSVLRGSLKVTTWAPSLGIATLRALISLPWPHRAACSIYLTGSEPRCVSCGDRVFSLFYLSERSGTNSLKWHDVSLIDFIWSLGPREEVQPTHLWSLCFLLSQLYLLLLLFLCLVGAFLLL